MPETASPSPFPPPPRSVDDSLGRKINELHLWSVGEGLRGTEAAPLFDGLCQRLVITGVPLWRAIAGMRTLHPQCGGYAYTWWRRRGLERPAQMKQRPRSLTCSSAWCRRWPKTLACTSCSYRLPRANCAGGW